MRSPFTRSWAALLEAACTFLPSVETNRRPILANSATFGLVLDDEAERVALAVAVSPQTPPVSTVTREEAMALSAGLLCNTLVSLPLACEQDFLDFCSALRSVSRLLKHSSIQPSGSSALISSQLTSVLVEAFFSGVLRVVLLPLALRAQWLTAVSAITMSLIHNFDATCSAVSGVFTPAETVLRTMEVLTLIAGRIQASATDNESSIFEITHALDLVPVLLDRAQVLPEWSRIRATLLASSAAITSLCAASSPQATAKCHQILLVHISRESVESNLEWLLSALAVIQRHLLALCALPVKKKQQDEAVFQLSLMLLSLALRLPLQTRETSQSQLIPTLFFLFIYLFAVVSFCYRLF